MKEPNHMVKWNHSFFLKFKIHILKICITQLRGNMKYIPNASDSVVFYIIFLSIYIYISFHIFVFLTTILKIC